MDEGRKRCIKEGKWNTHSNNVHRNSFVNAFIISKHERPRVLRGVVCLIEFRFRSSLGALFSLRTNYRPFIPGEFVRRNAWLSTCLPSSFLRTSWTLNCLVSRCPPTRRSGFYRSSSVLFSQPSAWTSTLS